ncbi:hypothetical protein [Pseudidiomarina sp.]|uniref:hypothetical protein n=1 Tax=Pseudidiomarina sp. TaxID=2081707 RepID=UPI003A96A1DB
MKALTLSREKVAQWVLILLVYPVIWLDTAYGILSYLGLGALRVSLLYRSLLLLLGLVLVYTRGGVLSWLIKFMILSWSTLLLVSIYPAADINFVSELTLLTRWIYPFTVILITVSALTYFDGHEKLLIRGLAHYGWVFGVFMVFSFVSGVGIPSYQEGVFGIKSFYIGGNDIGLAALISLCLMFVLLHQHFSLQNLAKIILCLTGLLLLGTKAGWAGALVLTGIFVLLFRRARWVLLPVVIVATSFGVNWVQTNKESLGYQVAQIQAVFEGANPRETLISAAQGQLEKYPDRAELTGGGYSFFTGSGREYYINHNNTTGIETFKAIEQEWYDLRGGYGVPFASFVFACHLLFFALTAMLWLYRPTIEHFAFVLASGVFIGHGILAGHAFVSGQPGGLIAVIYAIVIYRLEKGAISVKRRSQGN